MEHPAEPALQGQVIAILKMPCLMHRSVGVQHVARSMPAPGSQSRHAPDMIRNRDVEGILGRGVDHALDDAVFNLRQHLGRAIWQETEVEGAVAPARLDTDLIRHRLVILEAFAKSEGAAEEQDRAREIVLAVRGSDAKTVGV